jgi:predicted dienelactone hydrolase
MFKKLWLNTILGTTSAIAFMGVSKPAFAVDKITVQVGPIEQSISILDLESFAKTGKLPSALEPYEAFIDADLRQLLNQTFSLDPKLADSFAKDFILTPAGQQLINKIKAVFPDAKIDDLLTAGYVSLRQNKGLNVLSLLKSIPGENLNIDGSALMNFALDFNKSYWQSQAISGILKTQLEVQGKPFTSNINPAVSGNQKVTISSLNLEDKQRNREVPIDLYVPEKPDNQLIVISHGLGGNRKSLVYLAKHLSSHGFTVAVVEHIGSNAKWLAQQNKSNKSSQLVLPSEFSDRPKDVTFALNQLAELNKTAAYQGKLNTDQVTVIGHSFGGYTAIALAGAEFDLESLRKFCKDYSPLDKSGADWLQCIAIKLPEKTLNFRDTRVKQIIALNPALGQAFNDKSLAKVTIPTVILAGTDDNLTPTVTHQLEPFAKLKGKKYLLTAIGGTHLSIMDTEFINPEIAKGFPRELLGEKAEPIRTLVKGVSLALLKQQTKEAGNYQPFLTPNYAQSLSTKDVILRSTSELPKTVTSWLNLMQ